MRVADNPIYTDPEALASKTKRGRHRLGNSAGPARRCKGLRLSLLATYRLGDRCGRVEQPLTLTAER